MARTSTRQKVRPLAALRAIRALIQDPDDTRKVFEVIEALSGRSVERAFDRFRETVTGQRLLAARPDLLAVLSDRDRLLALPAGTLGRVYGEFVHREQISADGLVDASRLSDEADPAIPEERLWFGARLRDMHDLWHVVTGYNRDLVGEAALLAFTYAQVRNRGVGLIVLAAYLKAGGEFRWARRMMRDGYRRGRNAAWFPAQDWEALLTRPLAEVRRELGVEAAPVYQEVRSEGAPAVA
jgi:ubiquinone biosynthesis protein COQ4